MQDQKLEGRQEHQLSAGEAPGSAVPLHEPFTIPVQKRRYSYYQQVFSGRPMPFAYLDLDLLDQNIRQAVTRAAGKRVRLASKSLRSVPVIRRILASDPSFHAIMSYTAPQPAYLPSHPLD